MLPADAKIATRELYDLEQVFIIKQKQTKFLSILPKKTQSQTKYPAGLQSFPKARYAVTSKEKTTAAKTAPWNNEESSVNSCPVVLFTVHLLHFSRWKSEMSRKQWLLV